MIDTKNYICLDIETTGLSPKTCHMIEFAAVRVREGKIVESYSELIKPPCEIPYYVTKLTGISNSMVEHKRSLSDAIIDIYNFIGNDMIVGHNVKFDLSFLKKAFLEELGVILENDTMDTMWLARRSSYAFPNCKLDTVASCLGESFEGHHRALNDCEVTHRIFQKLIAKEKS